MDKIVLLILIPMVGLLSCSRHTIAVQRCGVCGRTIVPYPLSTALDCGDQRYKIRCTAGTLWFDSLNGSSYMITSINPLSRRMIIRPANLDAKTCISSDFRSQGIQLSDNLPFNITSSNTILLLNCTDAVLHSQPPADCSAASICHGYIKDSAPTCMSAPLCCTFRTGGFQSTREIKVHGGGCGAYQSFVNLDVKNLARKKWPEPGVEIEWALPQEPVCRIPLDCRDLLYSKCLPDPMSLGQKRCFCDAGFKWDPINGLCQSEFWSFSSDVYEKFSIVIHNALWEISFYFVDLKCRPGKPCKKRKKKTALFAGMQVLKQLPLYFFRHVLSEFYSKYLKSIVHQVWPLPLYLAFNISFLSLIKFFWALLELWCCL